MTGEPRALLNRPMLPSDLVQVASDARAQQLRRMVRQYRDAALPVMNGGFAYSNIAEGDEQMLTCNPYRLWEYTSFFLGLSDGGGRRFVDVGGAASPFPYFLAENGFEGTAIDLQPVLVAICNHVASQRRLPLHAIVEDATKPRTDFHEPFDVVTCISVLEHIPEAQRAIVFETIFRALRPGGLFYLTFDYGNYVERDGYDNRSADREPSKSIGDVDAISDVLETCGFRFIGNDPRRLETTLKARTASPSARAITARYLLNRPAIDGKTPWSAVLRYVARRALHISRIRDSRFFHHNFFRMFLTKPA